MTLPEEFKFFNDFKVGIWEMNIGLIVDHPKRDLQGLVRVSIELIELGHQVCLIPMYTQAVDIPHADIDVLVVNYARPVNRSLIEDYFAKGITVLVLDTEGGVFSENAKNAPNYLASFLSKTAYDNLLTGYLCWGSEMSEALKHSTQIPAKNIITTGCPRFDITHISLRHELHYKHDGFILINTNFPLVNPVFSTGPIKERKALLDNGFNAQFVERMVGDQKLMLEELCNTAEKLARKFPSRSFVLRPHPFEDPTYYEHRLKNLPNLLIDSGGEVFDVMSRCLALLHVNCSTAVEALMFEKLPVSMEFLNTGIMQDYVHLPRAVSFAVHSHSELFDVVEGLEERNDEFQFQRTFETHAEKFFFKNDGLASKRVAKAIDRIAKTNPIKRMSKDAYTLIFGIRRAGSLSQVAGALSSSIFGSDFIESIRRLFFRSRRGKAFGAKEVKALIDGMAAKDEASQHQVKSLRTRTTGMKAASVLVMKFNPNA